MAPCCSNACRKSRWIPLGLPPPHELCQRSPKCMPAAANERLPGNAILRSLIVRARGGGEGAGPDRRIKTSESRSPAVAAKYPHWHSKDQQKFRKTLLVLVFPAASDIASFVERRARPCRRRRFPQHSRKRTLIPCPHLYYHGGQLGPHNSIGDSFMSAATVPTPTIMESRQKD